jgi:hypothetical protein
MGKRLVSGVIVAGAVLIMAVAALAGGSPLDSELIAASQTGTASASDTATLIVELEITGDPPPGGTTYSASWQCRYPGQSLPDASTQYRTIGTDVATGTQLVLGDYPVGVECYVSVSVYPTLDTNWLLENAGRFPITNSGPITVKRSADFLDESLYTPSTIEVVTELSPAPPGVSPASEVHITCYSSDTPDVVEFFDIFAQRGTTTFSVYPRTDATTCELQEYIVFGNFLLWDQRVDGVCGLEKVFQLTSEPSTNSVTFSKTYVEPYIRQCPNPYDFLPDPNDF